MIYKTKGFDKWARKVGLSDGALYAAIGEIIRGLVDADLGGGVVKKRVALPGHGKRGSTRTIIATNRNDRWFFIHGFEKNKRQNISSNDLEALKLLAGHLLTMPETIIYEGLMDGTFLEIVNEI